MSVERNPSIYDLLMRLRSGGRVVRRADCTAAEILAAHERKMIYVTDEGDEFVYVPR